MPLMHAIVASSAAASGCGTKDASLLLSQGCRLGRIMGKVAGDNGIRLSVRCQCCIGYETTQKKNPCESSGVMLSRGQWLATGEDLRATELRTCV